MLERSRARCFGSGGFAVNSFPKVHRHERLIQGMILLKYSPDYVYRRNIFIVCCYRIEGAMQPQLARRVFSAVVCSQFAFTHHAVACRADCVTIRKNVQRAARHWRQNDLCMMQPFGAFTRHGSPTLIHSAGKRRHSQLVCVSCGL